MLRLLVTAVLLLGIAWLGLRGLHAPHSLESRESLLRAATAFKCRAADGSISYGSEPCPVGSQSLPLNRGTLNVLPAPQAPASAASAPPLLRQLADPVETEALRRRQMEKATQ